MALYVSPEMREIAASRIIRVKDLPDGRTVIERLAARHVLQAAAPDLCRNGFPSNGDALLELIGAAGFTMESE